MKQQKVDIFLIEPDSYLAKKYREAFKFLGFSVNHFNSAEDAIAASAIYQPKLMILEIQLAGHNGIEFIQELRSYPELDNVPLIINTLIPESELKITAPQKQLLGVSDYCYKPRTSIERLVRMVEGQLRS